MDAKKISFGFNKISKKNIIVSNKFNEKPDTKIDLITHLEGKSIKLLDEKPVEKPLVIPLVDGRKTSAALASLKTRHNVLNANEADTTQTIEKTDSNLPVINPNETLEEKAARELLQEIKDVQYEDKTNTTLTVTAKPDELPLDGASEPTLNDYESIPITQFGLAMLRGMGWKDEEHKKKANVEDPIVRPKGMGLGADKVITKKPPLVPPEPNEKLIIKKEAYVRVLGGKHKDLYGQIEGLDDHAGRVIVRMALGGTQESLNEFMVQPVSKGEYAKYSKVINSAKYEEYKRMENEHGQIIIKNKIQNDSQNSPLENKIIKEEPRQIKVEKIEKHSRYKSPYRNEDTEQYKDIKRTHEDERSRQRRNSSERRTERNRRSSSSDSSSHRQSSKNKSSKSKKSKSKNKDKRHDYCDSSDEEKRHKKKTKKSKRPRSRSRGRR